MAILSETFEQILGLIKSGEVRISDHGYDEMADDEIPVADVLSSVFCATVIEDYPNFPKGACVLVLQKDCNDSPIHVAWGIPKGRATPAVLVTAYRPDPSRWEDGFTRRR